MRCTECHSSLGINLLVGYGGYLVCLLLTDLLSELAIN